MVPVTAVQSPQQTRIKKLVGTAGSALAIWSADPSHLTGLVALLPHSPWMRFCVGVLGVVGAVWGKQPWSAPSVVAGPQPASST